VEIRVGDLYVRHSDGKICRVRWTDRTTVILESEDWPRLRLADISSLEKAYSKRESEPSL